MEPEYTIGTQVRHHNYALSDNDKKELVRDYMSGTLDAKFNQ